jgi:hypothetical protein
MKQIITILTGFVVMIGSISVWHYWHIDSVFATIATIIGLAVVTTSALDLLE